MMHFILFIFLSHNLTPQTIGWCTPRDPRHARLHLNIYPIASANFRLVVVSIDKRRPPKAKAPPLSLFFDGLRFGAPNK